MRQFNFKVSEETDQDLIDWLDSFGQGRERSTRIRDVIRDYLRKPDFIVRQRRTSPGAAGGSSPEVTQEVIIPDIAESIGTGTTEKVYREFMEKEGAKHGR